MEAYRWWNLAAAQGYEPAKEARDRIERTMTPEQIAEGQSLSRDFHAKETGADKPNFP